MKSAVQRISLLAPVPDSSLANAGQRPILWRRSAPAGLVRASMGGDAAAVARGVRCTAALSGGRCHDADGTAVDPLLQPLWSRHAFPRSDRSDAMAELLCETARHGAPLSRKNGLRLSRRVSDGLDQYDDSSGPDPFELLVWMAVLRERGGELADKLLVRLWRRSLDWVVAACDRDVEFESKLTEDQHMLVAGELPYLAGLVFRDVRGMRRVRDRGARVLTEQLLAGTDTDGSPHARLLERLPLWLAPLCRAAHAGQLLGRPWWDKPTRLRFADLVVRSAALCRPAGLALSNGESFGPVRLLRTAACVAGRKTRRCVSRMLSVLDDPTPLRTLATSHRKRVLDPQHDSHALRRTLRRGMTSRRRVSYQSDWGGVACLRANWAPAADACLLTWGEGRMRIELSACGRPVLGGEWRGETALHGRTVRAGAWECVCWFSDGDCDYVELQAAGEMELSLVRRVLLSRTGHFLYLVESARAGGAGALNHTLRLPLAAGTTVRADALSREWEVRAGRLPVRVFPLGLEQEAVRHAAGRMEVTEDALTLTQQSAGPGTICPLLFDWSPSRNSASAEWRRLTVVEEGRVAAPWIAAAFGLRLGKRHWVAYHSLHPGLPRTVLGLHTPDETVFGRFTRRGNIEPIVIVEPTTP